MTAPGRVLASLGSRARKTLTAAAAAVLVLGAASTSVPTEAAWTDSTYFAAAASAGTWLSQTPANSVIVPDSPTTTMTAINWEIAPAPGNMGFCVALTITGASAQPAPWELRADLRKAPFNGMAASDVYYGGSTQVTLKAAPGDRSTLVITGVGQASNPFNAAYNNVVLDSSKTLQIRLCAGSAPIPPQGDAAWYTTSVARGEWTVARACKVLTVTGRVTNLTANPFYFTWVASVDLADAKQHIIAGGRTVNYVVWTPHADADRYQFSTNPATTRPVADRYALTGGRMTAVRGTDQVTITACVLAD
jgi:hypothetical protein